MLKYNGLYVSGHKGSNGNSYHSYLRFYEDGLVIEVASTGAPEEVVKWFHRGSPNLSKGFYESQDGQIHFAVTSKLGVVYFAGQVEDGLLELNSQSHINGATEPVQYTFMAL